MNRRTFLVALAAVPLAGACPSIPVSRPRTTIVIPQRYIYARVQITPEMMEAARHSPGSWARSLETSALQ